MEFQNSVYSAPHLSPHLLSDNDFVDHVCQEEGGEKTDPESPLLSHESIDHQNESLHNQINHLIILSSNQSQKIISLEKQNEELKKMILHHLDLLLQNIIHQLIQVISSDDYQQKLKINITDIDYLNPLELYNQLNDLIKKEQKPCSPQEKDLDEIDDFIESFEWLTPYTDDLLPILQEINCIIGIHSVNSSNLSALVSDEIQELHKEREKNTKESVTAYVLKSGMKVTGSVMINTLSISITTLKFFANTAVLLGVGTLVIQSQWTHILRLLVRVLIQKLLI